MYKTNGYCTESPWNNVPSLVSTTQFDIQRFQEFVPTNSTIIDIGCGYGRICRMLEDNGYRNLIGIDSSSVLLARARVSLNYTRLIRSDGLNIPLKDNIADCAISFGLINCLLGDEELLVYAHQLSALIRDEGYLFVNEYTRNNSRYFDEKYSMGGGSGGRRIFRSNSGMMFRHYSIVELLSAFDPYFELIECAKQDYLSLNHKKYVCGYSIVLRKLSYISPFR